MCAEGISFPTKIPIPNCDPKKRKGSFYLLKADSAFGKPERATKVINPGNTSLGCIPLPRAQRNDSL
jgi:hypothetical protein